MLVRWRIVFTTLGSIGMAIIYGLKVNLSMAIVPMVNQTAIKSIKKTQGKIKALKFVTSFILLKCYNYNITSFVT